MVHSPVSVLSLLLGLTLCLCLSGACQQAQAKRPPTPASPTGVSMSPTQQFTKPTDTELKERLSPLQFEVTQRDATEPPFRNAYWDNHAAGLYVDIASGEPLFSSRDKFDSGTGWPSFSRPIEAGRVVEKRDMSHGMVRVEVRSVVGDSHLGHVFTDGPAPTGMRYCINSAALRFIPVEQLAQQGYEAYLAQFNDAGTRPAEALPAQQCSTGTEGAGCQPSFEVAILAGGCFWGMEDLLREAPGVLETDVGYVGGSVPNPTYQDVKTGRSGHAEAVRVVFDPSKISFETLLEEWFFRMHDPTTLNRQGNDIGTQYRSAIFYTTAEQREAAFRVKTRVDTSKKWSRPVVTEVIAAGEFTLAEDYHQDYLEKHPDGYTCHFMRD